MNRKKVVVAVVVWALLMVVVIGLTIKQSSNSHKPAAPTGIEQGSQSSSGAAIGFQGTNQLNNYLLAEQFSAVEDALSRYIVKTLNAKVVSAAIVPNSTVLNNDGSVTFRVQVTKPATTFTVVVQRPTSYQLIFSVPAANYQETLFPYATHTGNNAE